MWVYAMMNDGHVEVEVIGLFGAVISQPMETFLGGGRPTMEAQEIPGPG